MRTYPIYKAIKQQLNGIAPMFYYMGQYLKKADQTSYVVPAIYIEMPKYLPVTYFRRIKTSLKAPVRIHVVSNAPNKGNDSNPIQDSALISHENLFAQVIISLEGIALKDGNNNYLTGQFIEIATSNNNYDGPHVFSVVTLQADFYERPVLTGLGFQRISNPQQTRSDDMTVT